jgi:hypothetical protein
MQREHLCNDIYYLNVHVILKVCVKSVDSLMCHTIIILPKRDWPEYITIYIIHSRIQTEFRWLSSLGYSTSLYTLSSYKHFYWCTYNCLCHHAYYLTKHVILKVGIIFRGQMENLQHVACSCKNALLKSYQLAILKHTRIHFAQIAPYISQEITRTN